MSEITRQESSLSLYEQYRPQMKTGDIIAFSGNGSFSKLIKSVTKSRYSHLGMVLDVDMGGGFGRSVLLIESTLLTNSPNYDDRPAIRGVQIQWLSKRLQMYSGLAWWVALKQPLPEENLIQMQSWLRQTYNKKTPYDCTQIMGAALDFFDRYNQENCEDLSTLFCSELVTKALQIGGAVDCKLNPSEQTPEDVINFQCLMQPPIQIK
ncbi:MAG: hypothetical protein ACM37W_14400 [Actinomycetota bacterium]